MVKWYSIDTDENGYIDEEEFKTNFSDDFEQLDLNKDGQIDYIEAEGVLLL